MKTDNFLLISNLAPHPNEAFYTGGISWEEFRKESENNLKNITRFQKNKIQWTIINADTIAKKDFEKILFCPYKAIIISGSPYNINDDKQWIKEEKNILKNYIKKNHAPIIGVCFGMQLLANIMGGEVSQHKKYFKGNVPFITSNGEAYISYANHGQYVSKLPKNAKTLAHGPENIPYIIEYKKNIYGIQCHLERKSKCPLSEKFWKTFFNKIF